MFTKLKEEIVFIDVNEQFLPNPDAPTFAEPTFEVLPNDINNPLYN